MSDDERDTLRRIERRVQWIGHTLIGCICIAIWQYVAHYARLSDAWGLSADGRDYVGLGVAVGVGLQILEAIFNRKVD